MRKYFDPILGMEKSCRGLRKEDSSFRVATAFNLLFDIARLQCGCSYLVLDESQ